MQHLPPARLIEPSGVSAEEAHLLELELFLLGVDRERADSLLGRPTKEGRIPRYCPNVSPNKFNHMLELLVLDHLHACLERKGKELPTLRHVVHHPRLEDRTHLRQADQFSYAASSQPS